VLGLSNFKRTAKILKRELVRLKVVRGIDGKKHHAFLCTIAVLKRKMNAKISYIGHPNLFTIPFVAYFFNYGT